MLLLSFISTNNCLNICYSNTFIYNIEYLLYVQCAQCGEYVQHQNGIISFETYKLDPFKLENNHANAMQHTCCSNNTVWGHRTSIFRIHLNHRIELTHIHILSVSSAATTSYHRIMCCTSVADILGSAAASALTTVPMPTNNNLYEPRPGLRSDNTATCTANQETKDSSLFSVLSVCITLPPLPLVWMQIGWEKAKTGAFNYLFASVFVCVN